MITDGLVIYGGTSGPWTIDLSIPLNADPETWKPSIEEIQEIRKSRVKNNPELSSYTVEDLVNKYISIKEYWETGKDSLPIGDWKLLKDSEQKLLIPDQQKPRKP